MTREDEAIELRAEWGQLREEQELLTATGRRLVRSTDAAALRRHAARLHAHGQRQQAWQTAAASFHERHGPIGDLLK